VEICRESGAQVFNLSSKELMAMRRIVELDQARERKTLEKKSVV
jgi:hypothetical protein